MAETCVRKAKRSASEHTCKNKGATCVPISRNIFELRALGPDPAWRVLAAEESG